MTQVTVKELAQEVEAPVERLLQQMREAGLPHTDAGQVVTDNEKQTLLTHLKSSHKSKAEEPRKITLQRKTTSTLRVAGSKIQHRRQGHAFDLPGDSQEHGRRDCREKGSLPRQEQSQRQHLLEAWRVEVACHRVEDGQR